MTGRGEHINNGLTDKLSKDLLQKMDVRFPRSKEEIWEQIQKDIDNRVELKKVRVIRISKISYSVAATLLILIMGATFARYYQRTFQADGTAKPIELACKSEFIIYEGKISFNPLCWGISRNLKLEGKADFEVSSGKRFRVVSEIGSTEVLGTSFSVFASPEEYSVSCFSGKVKVRAIINDVEAILTKNEKAIVNRKGVFNVTLIDKEDKDSNINENDYISFENQDIRQVISVLESEFNLQIISEIPEAIYFSGNFKRSTPPESIIAAICRPLDLTYERVSARKYIIRPMEEEP